MNDLVESIKSFPYEDERLQKAAYILRKTKNRRIQHKMLNKLFYEYLSESNTRVTVRVADTTKKFTYCDVIGIETKEEL